jgi:hypothetical protein
MTRANRRGALLVIAVASLIAGSTLWAIQRAFVTSAVRHDAHAFVRGRLANLLADSAIAALEARVAAAAHDVRTPLARALRADASGGEGPVDLLPLLGAERALELDAVEREAKDRGLAVESVACELVEREPLDGVPYETRGVVKLAATVRASGAGRGFGLKVEVRRDMRSTLLALPRPFGNHGIVILDASDLTDGARVESRRAALAERARQTSLAIEIPRVFPPLEGTAVYGVQWTDGAFPLERLDLARRMERAHSVVEPLDELWEFHHHLAVVPAATFADAAAKLEREALARRVQFAVPRRDGTSRGIQADFDALVGERLNGVVRVDNPAGTPLKLAGRLRGRLVILTGPGGVTIDGVEGREDEGDLLTVHAHSGPVRIRGACRVSVSVGRPAPGEPEPRLAIDDDASITGTLVLAKVPSGMRWAGSLTRDPAQISGFTHAGTGAHNPVLESFLVSLAPRVSGRTVTRL